MAMEREKLEVELKQATERIQELEELLEEVEAQLEESGAEIERLKGENEWMHDTIWDLMRKLRQRPMQKDGEN